MPTTPHSRILVVQVAGIGDAVMASTIAERLRSEQPGAIVTWVSSAGAAPLVALYDGVAETIAVDQQALFRQGTAARARTVLGVWRRLAGKRFHRVILVHADRRYGILVPPTIRAPRASLSHDFGGAMNPIPGRYVGDEFARLVDGPGHEGPIDGHYPLANLRPKLGRHPRAVSDRKRVAIVPGGARNALRESALRRWPVEHYAAVAKGLVEAGHEVVLVGNAEDHWVREYFAGLPVDDKLGAGSVVDTAALMCDCDLVISHDTGPMHLARIVRAPLIAIFGPTSPHHFVYPDDTVTVLWGGAELACRPCYDGRELARCKANICLSRLTPETVLRHALERTNLNP